MHNKRFCKEPENIENYEKAKADNFKNWCCHHRLETYTSDGERRPVDITQKELIALGMYYNRPPEELIFLTRSEHQFLHHKGKKRSEETRRRISEVAKGNKNALGCKRSEEARRRISEAKKGEKNAFYGKHHSEESKKRIGAAQKGNKYHLGKHWYNNGKISKRAYDCPPGFVPGRLKRK